jgi:hypothetical protein
MIKRLGTVHIIHRKYRLKLLGDPVCLLQDFDVLFTIIGIPLLDDGIVLLREVTNLQFGKMKPHCGHTYVMAYYDT